MRTLVNVGFTADTKIDLSTFAADMAAWFAAQPSLGRETWLLAYAEDGVIWGKLANGKLMLPKSDTPTLSPLTLLEARLFGADGEIHIWRTDGGFSACRVTDTPAESGAFDEIQRLWGTASDGTADGFTQLVDGQEELRHAVPVEIPNDYFTTQHPRYHPALIQTRHYFAIDEKTGVATVALSRLVCVQAESFDEYRKRVKANE